MTSKYNEQRILVWTMKTYKHRKLQVKTNSMNDGT